MKHLPSITGFCLLALSAFFLVECTTSSTLSHQEGIKQTFKNFDVKFQSHAITTETGGTISLENGTTIQVPANAFVDANQQPVKGKVEIEYREFHTPSQIIASGIPMTYDSAGSSHQFVSAGMFEIQGKCEGEEVFIADDKSLQVNMASFQDGDDYNFYSLDESNGQWSFKGNNEPQVNQTKAAKMADVPEPVEPIIPEKYDGKSSVLDLDVDYTYQPELKAFHGIMWQPEEDLSKKKELTEQNWSKAEVNRSETPGRYQLTFRNAKSKFTTWVKPVLSGSNYEAAMAKFQASMNDYAAAKEARKKREERLAKEADLLRSFQVSNFGIYNWDRIYKTPNAVKMVADFKVDGVDNVTLAEMTVFLITESDNAVVRYDARSRNMFNFDPNKENKMLAVLPDDRVAVFSPEDFKKCKFSFGNSPGSYTFHLKMKESVLASMDDLDDVIASI